MSILDKGRWPQTPQSVRQAPLRGVTWSAGTGVAAEGPVEEELPPGRLVSAAFELVSTLQ